MRDAIVKAAKALLWERGYESTSPRLILDRSGAGQGSFYHHFRSKQQLAATALDEVCTELTEIAERLLGTAQPALERLRAFLLHERNGLDGCRLGRLANEQTVLATPELQAPLLRYFTHVDALIQAAVVEAQHNGALRADLDADEVSATIMATIQGGFLLSRATRDSAAIERATRGAWALLAAAAKQGPLPAP